MRKKYITKKMAATYVAVELAIVMLGSLIGMKRIALLCLAIFVLAILMIISEIFSRSTTAMFSAFLTLLVLMAIGGFSPTHIVHEYVEMGTILTLLGIMVVASFGLKSGLFYFIGMKVAKISKGDPLMLYFILAVFTFILNIFLIAVATIVVVVSLTLAICDMLKIDPRPYVIMEIFVVNVCASATMISAVPNIIIAEIANLQYLFFIVYLLPFTFLFLLVNIWILYSANPPPTVIDKMRAMAILEVDEWWFVKDKKEFYVSAFCIAGIIISFMISRELMLLSILFAAIALAAYPKTEELIREVDWDTLLFLIGFYIIVAGLSITGILYGIANGLVRLSMGNIHILIALLFWISVLISGFVDNIPYVLMVVQIIEIIITKEPYSHYGYIFWILLILACNIGGGLNPYSAPQNLLALSMARKARYPIVTGDYYRISIKWTIIGSSLAYIYLVMLVVSPGIIARIGYLNYIVTLLVSIISIAIIFIHKTIGIRRFIEHIERFLKQTKRQISILLQKIKKMQ